MSEPVDLVVFDLGGVLVRIVRSWGKAHARAGVGEVSGGTSPRLARGADRPGRGHRRAATGGAPPARRGALNEG